MRMSSKLPNRLKFIRYKHSLSHWNTAQKVSNYRTHSKLIGKADATPNKLNISGIL